MLYASPACWGFTYARDKEKLIDRLQRGGFLPDDVLSFADLAAEADRRLFRTLVSNPSHVLSRHLPASKTTNYNLRLGPMVSPSQKRMLIILSFGCSLKGFIVSDFLVCGLPGFITYLRFVYIFL